MATITPLNATDTWPASRWVINTNLSNLNSELTTANSDIDTAQTNISALETDKLNKNAELRTGNGAWKVVYNNGGGDETELALWAANTFLKSNWPALAPSFWNISVDVNGLAEDTAGDMNADFALVYDVSALANRKQKVNVFRATDAEIDARTSTSKFVTPQQLDKYALSTNIRSDWYTVPVAPTTWTTTTYSPATFNAGGHWTFTGNPTGVSSCLLSWNWTTLQYSPTINKDIRLKWGLSSGSVGGANISGWWFCIAATPANIYLDQTSILNGLVRFVATSTGQVFAHNSNGTTATTTNVTGFLSVSLLTMNIYQIVFNPWTNILFYINWVLAATHTTNLPTTGTMILAHWVAGGSIVMSMMPPILSYEL